MSRRQSASRPKWYRYLHFWRHDVHRDTDRELDDHLELRVSEYIAKGFSPDQARAQALADFGDLESTRAELRTIDQHIAARHRRSELISDVLDELRFAFRSLRSAPGLSLTIVASLAIVIGANSAIFGLIDGLLLRPLPVPHPEELVGLKPMKDGGVMPVSYAHFTELRAEMRGVPVEAERWEPVTAQSRNNSEDVWLDLVSGGFLGTVGVRPMIGRAITPGDEAAEARVVVLGEGLWRRWFNADSNALGHTIDIAGVPFTIVGVMPPGYSGVHFGRTFNMAVPVTVSPDSVDDLREARVNVVARIPAALNRAGVQSRFDAVFARCCVVPPVLMGATRFPRSTSVVIPSVEDPPVPPFVRDRVTTGPGSGVAPKVIMMDARNGLTWGVDYRELYRRVLLALMGGVALLLLIACANIATLLVARAESRDREFAVRVALGSGRARLARRLLVESLELAALGGLLGLGLAWAGTKLLVSSMPPALAHLEQALNWQWSAPLLAFSALAVCFSTVAMGVWPARRAVRAALLPALTGSNRWMGGLRQWSVERRLVVAQIALAVVLVSAAALFVQTLRNLTADDGGFHAKNIVFVDVHDRVALHYDTSAVLFRHSPEILAAVSRVPGVVAAGMSLNTPVHRNGRTDMQVRIPGDLSPDPDSSAHGNLVSAQFFSATGIGLVEGRDFNAAEIASNGPVVIVSASFAKRHFGNRSPLGAEIIFGSNNRPNPRTIIGVAGDARYDMAGSLGSSSDMRTAQSELVYVPLTFWRGNAVGVLTVRTRGDPASVAPSLRTAVEGTGFARVARAPSTLKATFDNATARERFAAAMGSLFGAVALVLACVGVFGVLAYTVARRTREIGVRLAIGARPADAQRLIVSHALRTAAVGICLGVPLALLCARAVASQLYGIGAADPRVVLGTAAVLVVVVLLASLIPSYRAAHVDPVEALRAE